MVETETPTYKVGLVLNLNLKIDLVTVDTFQLILELINLDGGINGRTFDPYTISWMANNASDLAVKIIPMLKDEDVLFLAGTVDDDERIAISDLLVKYEKLLFSNFISGGEMDYPNIIEMNAVSNQLFSVPFNYFIQRTSYYYILYDSSTSYIYFYLFFI